MKIITKVHVQAAKIMKQANWHWDLAGAGVGATYVWESSGEENETGDAAGLGEGEVELGAAPTLDMIPTRPPPLPIKL